jgi:hypothetical protein
MTMSKIKGGWIVPESLIKEIVDLGAILVVIIERHRGTQGGWHENSLEPEICFTRV